MDFPSFGVDRQPSATHRPLVLVLEIGSDRSALQSMQINYESPAEDLPPNNCR
jgi:hypothetical protein